MHLRNFGNRSGFKVPPANIGGMRLPRDVKDAIYLIRYAIDSGMRYIDTSRGYGESEWIIGKALRDGYREKVILSTKSSPWIIKVRSDDQPDAATIRRRIEESLQRLNLDYIDYYQVWNIASREHYDQAVRPGGIVDGIQQAIKDGLVRRTGFTTHDSVENLKNYIKEADWCDIILFTYNLLNRRYQPAIQAAAEAGIGTLIMNPVGGGRLTENSPVLMELAGQVGAADVPELAIRYILSNPHVTSVVSGINRPSDIDHTVAAAEKPLFSPDQMQKINQFLEARGPENSGYCTGCEYCLPCPEGINIPAVMKCVYNARAWGLLQAARQQYKKIDIQKRAEACTGCRKCEPKCTQHLAISEEMRWAAANLTEENKENN